MSIVDKVKALLGADTDGFTDIVDGTGGLVDEQATGKFADTTYTSQEAKGFVVGE